MTIYATGNALGSTDPRDLLDNAQNFDNAVNDVVNDTWVDRFGVTRKTLKGYDSEFEADQAARALAFEADQADREATFAQFLDGAGWSSLGAYAAGISIVSHTQTVDYLGQPYSLKPSVPASLDAPYVTTGVWATEGVNFKLVGDNSLRQDLASTSATEGSSKIGRGVVAIDSISDLQTAVRRADLRYTAKGYYAGTRVGGGSFYWDSASVEAHDGGGVIQVTGVATGRFKRVWRGLATPDMYGARPGDLAQDSAFAFRAALAAHDTVWVPDNQYLLNSYLVGAYYGAPGIVLNRDGQSLLCGRNARLVCNHTSAASGGVGVNVMLQIANAANCTIGAFKIQPRAAVGTDLNAVDTLQMFNAPGAQIGAIDDTFRLSLTSGSIQQSIISRDSPNPQTSGTTYKDGFSITGVNLSATLNVKHHHNMRVYRSKVRIDLDAHRPAWMGSDVAPLKFTGGTINAKNAVAEDCEFTVYRSSGNPVADNLGYIQITKCTATLSRCVINVNRIYGGSESEADYPVPTDPKLSALHLDNCDSLANTYYGPSFSVRVTGGKLGSPERKIQFAALIPPNPLALSPELDVSGCELYCNRALSDNAGVEISITFSDIDLYYTRTTLNCFDIRRSATSWFHANDIRSHLDSTGTFAVFSGNARFSNQWKNAPSTTELRLESNSEANKTRVVIDGSFDFKDIYTQTGNLTYTTGIESMSLYTTTAPVLTHNGAFTAGTILFNRNPATTNVGWRSSGAAWVSF